MGESNGAARSAGRLGSLLCAAGVVAFFIGIFGGPRFLAFAGVASMMASLVGFFIEEQIHRKEGRA